jgi:hypothetical protein
MSASALPADPTILGAAMVLLVIIVVLVHHQRIPGVERFGANYRALSSPRSPARGDDQVMLSQLVARHTAPDIEPVKIQRGRTESGYTTSAWRPEWRPAAEHIPPVVGDTLGPALGPVIDGGSQAGYMTSCTAGHGSASDAPYKSHTPGWSESPREGDFYNPDSGNARPVHELPTGGARLPGGDSQASYNLLAEPDHEPLVGATTRF